MAGLDYPHPRRARTITSRVMNGGLVALGLVGLWLCLGIGRYLRGEWEAWRAFREGTGTATARVVAKRYVGDANSSAYLVTYRFTPEGADSALVRTERVGDDVGLAVEAGDSLEVRYVPGRPQLARIGHAWTRGELTRATALGVLAVLVSLLFVYFGIRGFRGPLAPPDTLERRVDRIR